MGKKPSTDILQPLGGQWSRRDLMKGTAATAAVFAVTGFPAVLRAKPSRLTIPNPGGAIEEAFKAAYFDTFTKKTGIEISGAPYADTAKIKAMVENNAVDTDVIFTDAADAAVLARQGLLEPIDYGVIDKSKLLPEAGKEFYLLADVAAYAMAWNTKALTADTRPKSWAEFFDPAKDAQRSLWKYPAQTLEVAAMATQPLDKLYPLDLDTAFSKLDAIKGSLTWWDSGAQGAQLIIDGETDVGSVWNGRLYKPRLEGASVDYTFDGALYVCDSIVIPKGAKNKTEAMEFIANVMTAENQATFAKHIPYGPVVPAAFDLLDDKTKEALPNSPQNSKNAVFQDFDYWAANGAEIIDRFNKWLIG
ncbi:MAG: ABC transporter substrate-binding protein [Parvibaculaceae bacterium]